MTWNEERCTPWESLLKGYQEMFSEKPTPLDWASPVAQRLKRLPGMWETRFQSLDWEHPLEKEMATYSSALAWRIPWRKEPGRLLVHGVTKSRTQLGDFTFH